MLSGWSEQRPIKSQTSVRCLKAPFLSPQRYKAHAESHLFYQCIIYLLIVPPSVTREYQPKILELLHVLQCIAAHLQHTLPWASGDT